MKFDVEFSSVHLLRDSYLAIRPVSGDILAIKVDWQFHRMQP